MIDIEAYEKSEKENKKRNCITVIIAIISFALGVFIGSLMLKETIYRGNLPFYKGGVLLYKMISIEDINNYYKSN